MKIILELTEKEAQEFFLWRASREPSPPAASRKIIGSEMRELFSLRTANGLMAEGIYTLEHLLTKSRSELIKCQNISTKTLVEIVKVLADRGLQLAA